MVGVMIAEWFAAKVGRDPGSMLVDTVDHYRCTLRFADKGVAARFRLLWVP
jgi:hypothetical protein